MIIYIYILYVHVLTGNLAVAAHLCPFRFRALKSAGFLRTKTSWDLSVPND